MAISGDVFFATISELSAKLRAKEFSAVELTRAFCDRLETIGARHNALALSLRKEALRKAEQITVVEDPARVWFRFGVAQLLTTKKVTGLDVYPDQIVRFQYAQLTK